MRPLFLGSVLQDDHVTRQPPVLSYMSYRWYKVERKIAKIANSSRLKIVWLFIGVGHIGQF